MKVSIILSDDQKRKLNSITKYQNIMLVATLFELYKQQANGNNFWLFCRIGNELIGVQADILYSSFFNMRDFMLYGGRFEPHFFSDVVPLLQQNLTNLLR